MAAQFTELFQHHCRKARRWLLLRDACTGASVGASVAPVLLLVSRLLGDVSSSSQAWARLSAQLWSATPEAVVIGLTVAVTLTCGALVGSLVGMRRRPSDETLALAFDRKLAGRQELLAAIDPQVAPDFRRYLSSVASRQLQLALPAQLRPRLLQRWHIALPLACLAAALVSRVPMRQSPAAPAIGTKVVQLDELDELSAVTALEATASLNESDRRKLRGISEQAHQLRDKLTRGVPQREALADIARLQTTITQAAVELDDASKRGGLHAAVAVLREVPETLNAATALGHGDFAKVDDEMRRLSSAEERRSRRRAHDAVERAERAAREAGAPTLAQALSEYERWLASSPEDQPLSTELRATTSNGATQPDAAGRDERPLSPEDNPGDLPPRRTDPALGRVDGPTPAPRTRPGLQHGPAQFESERRPSDAAEFGDERPQQAQTRNLKMPSVPSAAARREQALRRASQALSHLQSTLTNRTLPLPNAMTGPQAPNPREPREGAAPSSGDRGGTAHHRGTTAAVDGAQVVAKTEQSLDLRRGGMQRSLGRGSGYALPRLIVPTPSTIDAVGPDQVQSVDRAPIPTEYREQVSRYFSPE